MPSILLCIQTTIHTLGGTPHMRTGLIVSFCMAAFGSGFNWYAQRRGVLITGPDSPHPHGIGGDLKALPAILRDFLLAAPRALFNRTIP